MNSQNFDSSLVSIHVLHKIYIKIIYLYLDCKKTMTDVSVCLTQQTVDSLSPARCLINKGRTTDVTLSNGTALRRHTL